MNKYFNSLLISVRFNFLWCRLCISRSVKVENVANFNDVLPLKAARRDAIANLKWPETGFRWLHLHSLFGATLFGSYQRHLFYPIWQCLLWFSFHVQCVRSTMQNLQRVGENYDPILSRLGTKVHQIFRWSRKPRVSTHLTDCLYHVSFWRYGSLKLPLAKLRSRPEDGFWPPDL